MRSPVNWALLGLIIERPSYAYDLGQRFERRYGSTLVLSNIGHVYTALGMLSGRSLIEEIPGTREGRQPKPHYRATERGVSEYRDWLIGQVGEDRRRGQMFVLALAALMKEPELMHEVIGGYEQAWLREGMKTPISRERESAAQGPLARLLDEESRLAVGARLEWIEYAKQELGKPNGRAAKQ
jgi:DNA-binding PadR family transcriptional regulator